MLVTRHGVTRRLQALQAIGWSKNQISRATGLNPVTIQKVLNDDESFIQSATVARIVATYKRLADVPPPQRHADQIRMVTLIRKGAQQRGYAPPAAWDDIDTDELPHGLRPVSETRRPELLDDALILLRAGVNPEDVAARCGVSATSLARRLRRNGHHLWAAACERKPGR